MPTMTTPPQPTIFLDRDGTLIHEREYLRRPELVELLPNAAAGLRELRHRGFQLIVVTNQSGIGRGLLGWADYEAVQRRLGELLRQQGVHIDHWAVCPHHPEAGCTCRKPATGLIEQACRCCAIDLEQSIVIGDKSSDLELARRVGIPGILVRTGYGQQTLDGNASPSLRRFQPVTTPDYVADDLLDAAGWIAARALKTAA